MSYCNLDKLGDAPPSPEDLAAEQAFPNATPEELARHSAILDAQQAALDDARPTPEDLAAEAAAVERYGAAGSEDCEENDPCVTFECDGCGAECVDPAAASTVDGLPAGWRPSGGPNRFGRDEGALCPECQSRERESDEEARRMNGRDESVGRVEEESAVTGANYPPYPPGGRIVGYLTDGLFLCHGCVGAGAPLKYVPGLPVPVYEINVRPYSQVCHECGRLVVDGFKQADRVTPLSIFVPPAEAEERWGASQEHTPHMKGDDGLTYQQRVALDNHKRPSDY